jgi:hypothetical protein
MSKYKQKYHKGQPITSLMDMIAYLLAGANFYLPSGNVVPSAFLKHWQFAKLCHAVRCGSICLAERNGGGS